MGLLTYLSININIATILSLGPYPTPKPIKLANKEKKSLNSIKPYINTIGLVILDYCPKKPINCPLPIS